MAVDQEPVERERTSDICFVKFKYEMQNFFAAVKNLRDKETACQKELRLLAEKHKKLETEYKENVAALLAEILAANQGSRVLENTVMDLRHQVSSKDQEIENAKQELKALLDARNKRTEMLQVSKYDLECKLEEKSRDLLTISQKHKRHSYLLEAIEREAFAVKEAVEKSNGVMKIKEEQVAALQNKLDGILELESAFQGNVQQRFSVILMVLFTELKNAQLVSQRFQETISQQDVAISTYEQRISELEWDVKVAGDSLCKKENEIAQVREELQNKVNGQESRINSYEARQMMQVADERGKREDGFSDDVILELHQNQSREGEAEKQTVLRDLGQMRVNGSSQGLEVKSMTGTSSLSIEPQDSVVPGASVDALMVVDGYRNDAAADSTCKTSDNSTMNNGVESIHDGNQSARCSIVSSETESEVPHGGKITALFNSKNLNSSHIHSIIERLGRPATLQSFQQRLLLLRPPDQELQLEDVRVVEDSMLQHCSNNVHCVDPDKPDKFMDESDNRHNDRQNEVSSQEQIKGRFSLQELQDAENSRESMNKSYNEVENLSQGVSSKETTWRQLNTLENWGAGVGSSHHIPACQLVDEGKEKMEQFSILENQRADVQNSQINPAKHLLFVGSEDSSSLLVVDSSFKPQKETMEQFSILERQEANMGDSELGPANHSHLAAIIGSEATRSACAVDSPSTSQNVICHSKLRKKKGLLTGRECSCTVSSCGYMVECQICKAYFHAGCISIDLKSPDTKRCYVCTYCKELPTQKRWQMEVSGVERRTAQGESGSKDSQ